MAQLTLNARQPCSLRRKRQSSNSLAVSAFGTLVRRLICSASGEKAPKQHCEETG
jgi:hypothetical protein